MRLPATARALQAVGGKLDAAGLLAQYAQWLVEEALPAGGIGPDEAGQIDDRHIADSISMAFGWAPARIATLLDVGTGVGLPGIPLAAAFPDIHCLLVDRSARRVSLAKRAVRVLGLANVEVLQQDMVAVNGTFDAIVARGLADPSTLTDEFARLMNSPGWAVLGGSRERPRQVQGWATISVPEGILDRPAWLLIMARLGSQMESQIGHQWERKM